VVVRYCRFVVRTDWIPDKTGIAADKRDLAILKSVLRGHDRFSPRLQPTAKK
jgi:hypothetical protein